MNIRESGMPVQERWEAFFNPLTVLSELGIDNNCRKIIDFGCGYGTFAIPAAQISHGIVYAIDFYCQVFSFVREGMGNIMLMPVMIPEGRRFLLI